MVYRLRKNEKALELTVDHTERERSSANGNPRWRVFFTNGTSFLTQVDGSVGYGINNPELCGDVTVIVNGRDHIVYMEPRIAD